MFGQMLGPQSYGTFTTGQATMPEYQLGEFTSGIMNANGQQPSIPSWTKDTMLGGGQTKMPFDFGRLGGAFSNLGGAMKMFNGEEQKPIMTETFSPSRLSIQDVKGQDASQYLNQLLQMYQQRQAQGSGLTQQLMSMR